MKASSNAHSTANHSRKSSQRLSSVSNNISGGQYTNKANRSILRDQNQKLKSEVKVLQQALVNLSLNEFDIKMPSNNNVRKEQQNIGQGSHSLNSKQQIQVDEQEDSVSINVCGQPQMVYSEQSIIQQNKQSRGGNKHHSNHSGSFEVQLQQVQSHQNREFIKNRVTNIIKDMNNTKENMNDQIELMNHSSSNPHHQSKMSNNDRNVNIRANATGSPFKRQAYMKMPSEQSMSIDNMVFKQTLQHQQQQQQQQQHQQYNQNHDNVKYQQEIENLKRILTEINKKENEIILKIEQQDPIPCQSQKIEVSIQKSDACTQAYDTQLLQFEKKAKELQLIVNQMSIQNKDLQIKLNSSISDQNLQKQEISYLQIKIDLLEKEQSVMKRENNHLKEKLQQKANIKTENSTTQTVENILEQKMNYVTPQPLSTDQSQFNLTLNKNGNVQCEPQHQVVSPKSYCSYMQTPTRSALQQFIHCSSTKKNSVDQFYQQQQKQVESNDMKRSISRNDSNNKLEGNSSNIAVSLANFITKPNTSTASLKKENTVELKSVASTRSIESRRQCCSSQTSIRPDSRQQKETSVDKQQQQQPGRKSVVDSRQPRNDQTNDSSHRTPSNSKKRLFQKASTILRCRYNSQQQSFTPVRQMRDSQQSTQREKIKEEISLTKKSIFSQYTTKPAPPKNDKIEILQQNKTNGITNRTIQKSDSDICLNTSGSSSAFKRLNNYNYPCLSNKNTNSVSKTKLQSQSADNWNFSNNFHTLDQQMSAENQVHQRKARIEEERLKDLQAKIQAKDEKILHLQELKRQEKDIRNLTYDQRKEKFKAEVQERRTNLSKTPVRGDHASRKSHPTFETMISSHVQYDHESPHNFSRAGLRITNSSGGCGGYSTGQKRKIHVDQEEEEEAPQPLNVKISPIQRKDKFQYEL